MRHTWLAALLIGLLPAVSFAGGHGLHSFFGLSIGIGSGHSSFGFSYANGGYPFYGGGYRYHSGPRFGTSVSFAAPIYHSDVVYAAAPRVVYSAPVVVVRNPAYCAPAPAVVYSSGSAYSCSPAVTTSCNAITYYYSR